MREKFSIAEITILRHELLQTGLDSFQIADAIRAFVVDHGYGISRERALNAVNLIEGAGYNLESLQRELEASALVN